MRMDRSKTGSAEENSALKRTFGRTLAALCWNFVKHSERAKKGHPTTISSHLRGILPRTEPQKPEYRLRRRLPRPEPPLARCYRSGVLVRLAGDSRPHPS